MSRGRKIALGAVLLFVVLVVAGVIIVPVVFDIDRYRPQVATYIQEETGKPVEIGRLALNLFPSVSIRVDDFALGNPPGFPKGTFLKARRIYADVDARALWNRQVIIRSLEVDDPVINLLSDVRGRWNFENAPKQKIANVASTGEMSAFSLGVISKVKIAGGQLTAANLVPSGQRGPNFFEAHGVASQFEQVNLNAFIASTWAPLGAVPTVSSSLSQGGLGVALAYAATAPSRLAAQGTLRAESLGFGALQVTAVKSKLRLFPKQVFFDDLSFDLCGGHATGDLSFIFAGQNPRYSTSARLTGVDVAKLFEAFPEARGKMTGKMEGDLKLSGEVTHSPDPLAGMRGTGQLSIRNGRLPSLQLNKNLMQLARLSNLGSASGDPSSFSSISADMNIANQRIMSNKVTLVGNGVGVEGSGSLGLAGAGSLDYEGVAKIDAEQNALTNLLVGLSGATLAGGKLSFPFKIAGTLQNPRFVLKSAGGQGMPGTLQNLAGGTPAGQTQPKPADLIQGISGLFKKKQPSQPEQPQPSQPKP